MKKLEDRRHADGQTELTSITESPSTSTTVDNDDNENKSSGTQPGDDEGFVFLDKPSLIPSPETESGNSANVENATEFKRNSAASDADQSSSSVHSDETSQPSTLGPNWRERVRFEIPDSAPGLESSNFGNQDKDLLRENVTSGSDHAAESPVDSSQDNPFHPEYTGHLAEPSATYSTATLFHQASDSSDSSQSHGNQNESSEAQSHGVIVHENPEYRTLSEVITDWLWGEVALPLAQVEQPAGDDEQIVHDIAAEEPFVRVDHGRFVRPPANEGPPGDNRGPAGQDPEVVAAAIQAGIDPNDAEAADDIEDLEGILELIGMQGPLAGLVQNAMFCAVLVTLTIMLGVWAPYIFGKVFLIILTHPVLLLLKLPLRWAASSADMIIDIFTFFAGSAFRWIDAVVTFLCIPIGWVIPPVKSIGQNTVLADKAKHHATMALERLANSLIATGNVLSTSDIPTFSLIAHESLRSIEVKASMFVQTVCDYSAASFSFLSQGSGFTDSLALLSLTASEHAQDIFTLIVKRARCHAAVIASLVKINPLQVNLNIPQRTAPLDYDLACWDTKDRALAILFGYMFFAAIGIAYLKCITGIKGTNKAGRVDGAIADALYQAGGVMKVVLIISIEMIVFPLYCGLLLDVALLPLFGDVTLMSRVNFTLTSPNTSIFIHWFVGTCYMFHFALFVAMCRKILRAGVLCKSRCLDNR